MDCSCVRHKTEIFPNFVAHIHDCTNNLDQMWKSSKNQNRKYSTVLSEFMPHLYTFLVDLIQPRWNLLHTLLQSVPKNLHFMQMFCTIWLEFTMIYVWHTLSLSTWHNLYGRHIKDIIFPVIWLLMAFYSSITPL